MAADLWEAGADERERLADERERLADERDQLADEREAIADRHDHALDQRGDSDEDSQSADRFEVTARLRRAEAAFQRAEAGLLRARQAMTRADARAARQKAARQRVAAAATTRDITDEEQLAWLVDRRDFVAVEREQIAHLRDDEADRRDEVADERERLADTREHEALDRERRLDDDRAGQRLAGRRQREATAAARRTDAAARESMARQWGPQPYGPTLLASFTALTREVFGSEDLGVLIPRVLEFVVTAVPGCRCAGVTLWRDGRLVDAIGSDAAASDLDRAAADDGPVREALRDEYPVHVPRVGDPPRWPPFEAAATRLGVASALCHGLFARAPDWLPLGVLTLYGTAPDAFTAEDQELTLIVAAFLSRAVAMAQRQDDLERREAALHRALSSRDVIGQAKGILMERQKLSAGEAFDLLRRVSQQMNRKLAEVAEHLARTGELPG